MIIGVVATSASSTVLALDDVTLTCEPASPTVRPDGYSWHRVDGTIPSHASGQTTNMLTLHRVVPEDEGQYYCMATQFGHCAVSDNVMVIVEGKIINIINPKTSKLTIREHLIVNSIA